MKNVLFLFSCFIAVNSWSQNSNSTSSQYRDSSSINSMYDIRKNSVYFELGGEGIIRSVVNYDRIIPVGDKNGIVLAGSIGVLVDVMGEVSYLHGRSKNFFEIGMGYSFPENLVFLRIGYRYQGNKGFLFRTGVLYLKSIESESFGDFLSFGYSF